MNSKYLIKKCFFSSNNNLLMKEFGLKRKDIRALNNEIKLPWVRPGWDKVVGLWFLGCAGITLGMIVIGGYVRIKKAGLSMVKWDLLRLKAPKTDEEWKKEFEEYKEHPQYKNDFPDISLEGFKEIYLLEHYHRQLGKILGMSIIIPSLFFTVTKIFNKKLIQRSAIITLLVGFQGVVGYWMVKSGLKENLGENTQQTNVRVSPYRLVTHFTLAITTYWILLNSALYLLLKPQVLKTDFAFFVSNRIIRRHTMWTLHLVIFTAMFGSLLAGQDGGKICNTFPKMGDIWVPSEDHYNKNMTKLRNQFENTFLVHFNHRLFATATLTTIIYQFFRIIGLGHMYKGGVRGFSVIAILALSQFLLGVSSVLNSVPPKMAQAHQFLGVMTITACIVTLNFTRKIRSQDMKILLKKLMKTNSKGLDDYMNNFKNLHGANYQKYIQKEYMELKANNNI